MEKPVTIAIVEDHPDFSIALTQALTGVGQFRLWEHCKDLPQAINMLEHQCPDVLLVDLGLPSGSGLNAIRHASRRWGAQCASAVLTVTGNEDHLLTAIAGGAKGYLFKSDQPQDWIDAVQTLAKGGSTLHANFAQKLLKGVHTFTPDVVAVMDHIAAGYTMAEAALRLELPMQRIGLLIRSAYDSLLSQGIHFSGREMDVLASLSKGHTLKQCAALMGVSESTVKTHTARIYEKLGVNNLQSALYEARIASLVY
jgi:DNA-binding NarL/FixJ family response regulator